MTLSVHTVKAMVFPVVINGCESWTIKKAEHQRIGAFDAAKIKDLACSNITTECLNKYLHLDIERVIS